MSDYEDGPPVYVDARALRGRLRHFDGYSLFSDTDDHATQVAESVASGVLGAIISALDDVIREAEASSKEQDA